MPPIFPVLIPPLLAVETLEPVSQQVESQQVTSTQSQLWRFCDEYVLGTRLTVLVNTQSAVLAQGVVNAVRQEIDRLDRVFNHRRSDSELSILNRSRTINASAELFTVLQLSETWRRITQGAFDGRMGRLLRLWSASTAPNGHAVEQALADLRTSIVSLDAIAQRVELSAAVELSLDAIAKGYIVDAALRAARRIAPTIAGLAIEIGGDIRCWGESVDCRGWRIGIPAAAVAADNAPLVDAVIVKNAAIATSGRGPRDYCDDRYRSTTISPLKGYPVRDVMTTTVVASHTADADAIATACLVLPPIQSIALVNRLDGVAARITEADGYVHQSNSWPTIQLAAVQPATTAAKKSPPKQEILSSKNASSLPPELRWPNDWELGVNYIAPDRQEDSRTADFRTPFMALWITDTNNKPVRTLFMVGMNVEWQRDNFIWWGINRTRAKQLVDLRSQSTTLSGRYQVYWAGDDDDWQPVPLGTYILHLETSQERGKHHYRSMPIEVGRKRFKLELPELQDSGRAEISYGHYNDRFNTND